MNPIEGLQRDESQSHVQSVHERVGPVIKEIAHQAVLYIRGDHSLSPFPRTLGVRAPYASDEEREREARAHEKVAREYEARAREELKTPFGGRSTDVGQQAGAESFSKLAERRRKRARDIRGGSDED